MKARVAASLVVAAWSGSLVACSNATGGGTTTSATATTGNGTGASSGTGSSTGAGTGTTTGSTGTTGYAAAHRTVPPLNDLGARMSGFKLVTLTTQGDPLAPDLQTFSDALAQSQWFQTVAAPYDIAPPSEVVHVTDTPPITTALLPQDIVTYIQQVIGDGGLQPDGNTLYLLYIPDSGSLSTNYVLGYHAAFPSETMTQGDSFAAIQDLQAYAPENELDQLTIVASHEILEASSDPNRNGLTIGPAPAQAWTGSVWEASQYGQVEVGDLCSDTRTYEAYGDGGFYYQRIFANAIALDAGDDPCIPQEPGPFYSASVAQDWYAVDAGATVQIPFVGWSTAATSNWYLYPYTANTSADILLFNRYPTLSATTTLGKIGSQACGFFDGLNNGVTGTLTVQTSAQLLRGDWMVLGLESFVEGAGPGSCETPIADDGSHTWFVGVYVP